MSSLFPGLELVVDFPELPARDVERVGEFSMSIAIESFGGVVARRIDRAADLAAVVFVLLDLVSRRELKNAPAKLVRELPDDELSMRSCPHESGSTAQPVPFRGGWRSDPVC